MIQNQEPIYNPQDCFNLSINEAHITQIEVYTKDIVSNIQDNNNIENFELI